MRRRSKASAFVKVLSATAAFAAITSGSVMAFAADGYTDIMIGGEDGNRIKIEQLNDETYRSTVLSAFNNRREMHVKDESGNWYEMSLGADADDGIFNLDNAFDPYME